MYCMQRECKTCNKQRECEINEHSRDNKQTTNRNKKEEA